MNDFDTIAELKAWLRKHNIDYGSWGSNATKTVAHLWEEIDAGETRLVESPPRRLVEVTRVVIRRGDEILIEVRQDFANGRRRLRNSPPSEKMRPQETYVAAARRCLAEELGVPPENSLIRADTHRQKVWERPSKSYPGLNTRYVIHVVEAEATGLPEGPFCTMETATGSVDPVRRHHWEWRPPRK